MITKEEAKKEIVKLVREFSDYTKEQLDKKSENQIKSEFIDPLFEALGWNMRKDAEREEKVLKGRADYILRLGNQETLVIEAKKTGVRLSEDEGKQTVSYAHHRNIKFAILTNFKQIKIYHALSNIKNIDKNLLIDEKGYLRIDYENFEEQFDRLWFLSKESFEKQEINKLLKNVDKRLIKPINETILKDLLQFREWLSKDLKKVRAYLTKEQIDEVVQILIDRLIFMRSVEDRGLEGKDFLLKIVNDSKKGFTDMNLWTLLKTQFERFDKTYNSKLFSKSLLEEKDVFFDKTTLIKVIEGLYYGTQDNQERYMFDIIPGDLLGGIYEQYLGTILRGTEKRVKLDLETGKRKKMGIYYTPSYIVDYIVKNTVGEYIKNKSIDKILEVRILDPACGSGSFLIRAFQEVCNKIEGLMKKEAKTTNPTFKKYNGRLNLAQKITILTRCIYGVDLDEKAVELAQLNLLLKLLEGETRETRRKLPLMKDNIKCGNSLIDDIRVAKDKAFKWEAQFPDVFRQGGFDIVIGNPPYINAISLTKTLGPKVKNYWKEKYFSARGTYDIYILFFELSLNILKPKGLVSFITPNKWLSSPYGAALRELILEKHTIQRVLDLSKVKVFDDPSVYPLITILKKDKPKSNYNLISEKIFSEDLNDKKEYKVSSEKLNIFPEKILGVILSNNLSLIQKIFKESKSLEKVSEVQATSTAAEADEYSKYISEKRKGISIINTGTIDRYTTTYGIISFKNKGKKMIRPSLDLSKVGDKRKKLYQSPKIVLAKLALFPEGFLDLEGSYASINTNCIHSPEEGFSIKYLGALINSKLINFVYSELFSGLKMSGGYFQFQAPQLRTLPIAVPTLKQKKKIEELVNQMLELQKKYHDEKISGGEKERLEQQIKNIDYEIDEEVYKLYNITPEEQKIIGESLGGNKINKKLKNF